MSFLQNVLGANGLILKITQLKCLVKMLLHEQKKMNNLVKSKKKELKEHCQELCVIFYDVQNHL